MAIMIFSPVSNSLHDPLVGMQLAKTCQYSILNDTCILKQPDHLNIHRNVDVKSCNATSVPRPFLLRVVQYSRSRTEYKRWAEQQVSEKSWRHGGTQWRGGGTRWPWWHPAAAAAARRRRHFGGLRREWRESWRENAVHLVRIRLYHRILWGRRKEKACLALPPSRRRRRAATAETTGCQRWCHHWVPRKPTAPPGGTRRGAATGNFDGRRVPKLFIATATLLVLLVQLKTVAYRGLDVALLSGRISSGAHC